MTIKINFCSYFSNLWMEIKKRVVSCRQLMLENYLERKQHFRNIDSFVMLSELQLAISIYVYICLLFGI